MFTRFLKLASAVLLVTSPTYLPGIVNGQVPEPIDPNKPAAISLNCWLAPDLEGSDTLPTQEYVAFVRSEGDHLNDWRTHLPQPCRSEVELWGTIYVTLQEGN